VAELMGGVDESSGRVHLRLEPSEKMLGDAKVRCITVV